MYAIVTLMNADGTFDIVGMKNRTPVRHLSSQQAVMKWARRYAKGKTFQVELWHFPPGMNEAPHRVVVEATVAPPAPLA